MFDQYRGTNFWPAGYDGRGIVNETYKEAGAGVPEETIQARYDVAEKEGDWSRLTAFV